MTDTSPDFFAAAHLRDDLDWLDDLADPAEDAAYERDVAQPGRTGSYRTDMSRTPGPEDARRRRPVYVHSAGCTGKLLYVGRNSGRTKLVLVGGHHYTTTAADCELIPELAS